MSERAWYVYIVRCRTGQLYTGISLDVKRRVEEHNRGQGARFTKTRRPVLLVYQETCRDRPSAMRREIEIKRMTRRQKVSMTVAFRRPPR